MSLYSKYRPQNFANLVGQDHIRQTLLYEIQKGTVSHAYLFAGPRGTGKTSTARLIAKALNCEKKNEEGEPCDECDFCVTIKDGALIDVIEIDAASNRGIDEIRDLKEKIQFAPTRSKSKVYIIDEIHMLTKEAFNALLKTLEEPPENVFFILCTTEVHKIPETIISRCQRFDFKRIDMKTIMTRLNYIAQMEKIEADDAAIDLIARHVEGGLRDAIGLFEQMTISGKLSAEHVRAHLGITGHETITALIEVLEKNDAAKALHLVNEVHREGYDLTTFVREILECLRDSLITGIQQGESLRDSSKTPMLMEMIAHFEEARDMLRNTVIPQLPLEIAVIKIVGMRMAEGHGSGTGHDVEKIVVETKATEEAQKAEQETATVLKQEYEMEKYQRAHSASAIGGSAAGQSRLGAQASEVGSRGSQLSDAELIHIGDISKHWMRVLEHVQPPSLRRSLTDAKVNETEDSNITLTFASHFHMEKVNSSENRVKIEKAIHHLFKKNFKVTCVFDTEARPVAEREKTPAKKPAEDIAKKAMEIFGTEEN